jgi:t-SNARE complex subunit (syntaxin)
MDIEETMEFILAVQAKLEASVQEHDERLARLESSVTTVTDLVGRVAQAQIHPQQRVDALTAAAATGFQELPELHANTESKLNALIDTVDKLVRRHGQQPA